MVKQWSWNWYRFRTRRPLPMSNETDTPRTDAAYKDHEWDLMDHIPLEFARQLERELNESQAQSHGLARRVVEAETKLEVVQRQLKRAVEIADDLMICSPIGVRSLWNEAVEKLFSLKEEIK
jgi:PAS domain-containing protein